MNLFKLVNLLVLALFMAACDETTDSDELSGNETIYHDYSVNYNQDSKKVYAEAELTKRNGANWVEYWLRFDKYNFIQLVGNDKVTFQIYDNDNFTYVLSPKKLEEKRKQVYWGSKTVPYYRLKEDLDLENLNNKKMSFVYYNSNDARPYTFEMDLLNPALEKIENSGGDILDVSKNDYLVLTFDEVIKEFNTVNLEFINSNGNYFFFSIDTENTNVLTINSDELREQALSQTYTLRERKKKRLGNISIESDTETEISLMLAGVNEYKLNISATRRVVEDKIKATRDHVITVNQQVKIKSRTIKIGF